MKRRSKRADAGFSLVELLIVVAVIAVLIGVLLPALHESRRVVRAHACTVNMRQLGTACSTYAIDASDRIASFTWRAGIDYGFGGIAGGPNEAAAHQAVDIIRTLAERDDIQVINNWIPHIF